MKLATLKDGSRDGQLALGSRDRSRAHFATGIASTLQRLLDEWSLRQLIPVEQAGQLIAHVAQTRHLRAGSIFGNGTVSNQDWSHGWSWIAEKRAIETIESGAPQTGFMQFGDTIRIEMLGRDRINVFGAIDQRVAPSGL